MLSSMKLRSVKLRNLRNRVHIGKHVVSSMKLRSVKLRNVGSVAARMSTHFPQ